MTSAAASVSSHATNRNGRSGRLPLYQRNPIVLLRDFFQHRGRRRKREALRPLVSRPWSEAARATSPWSDTDLQGREAVYVRGNSPTRRCALPRGLALTFREDASVAQMVERLLCVKAQKGLMTSCLKTTEHPLFRGATEAYNTLLMKAIAALFTGVRPI